MQVPLLDLQLQLEQLRPQLLESVGELIDSTRYILGPRVEQLEQEIAAYCTTGFGIGVSSGTDALMAAMMALDIGPGDRVVTTPFSFFATMGVILRAGAEPVFVDIEPHSFNIDPNALEQVLREDHDHRIKAVIPVHLYGQCADMRPVLDSTRERGIPVIEDAAQAIGSEYPYQEDGSIRWRRAGSMGKAGCFSFFPSKNLGGIGDGGMVTTSDADFAALLASLRNHGAKPKYYHSMVGGNFRLDPVQAVVLSIKLPFLEQWHQGRRRNGDLYRKFFNDAGLTGNPVVLPEEVWGHLPGAEEHNHHIYNQFVIRVPERDRLRAYLGEHSIGTEVYYPLCLHQQECLVKAGYPSPSLPIAEQAAEEVLALPIFPELRAEQLEYVVQIIQSFYAG
ncbi:MAG: transcriptional regulator [Desulfobulbus propionicus]|nr:MAG: transcriptional regulator [Desulfobulbus propionicus]